MQLLVFFDLTGHLHPAIVHLPIGILLLACLFELISSKARFAALRPAIRMMIFWGMVSAVAACLSGLALSSNGEYDNETINPHQWLGISTAVASIILFLLYKYNAKEKTIKVLSVILLSLVMITGHLGGSITHGADYLTAPLAGSGEKNVTMKPIPDIQQAVLYTDLVQPLFQSRCYNCHGERKQKGKLRLDSQEMIIKGGESHKTVIAGKPEESEMIERLLLPKDHKDHMPPKGKPQLTKQQIDVLQWWVSTGAEFNKKVNQLKQTEQIKPVLLALQTGTTSTDNEITEIPDKPVAPADTAIINKLINAGVMVLPVARNSNYLSANFITSGNKADSLIKLLEPLKKQLISLKLDAAQLHDSTVAEISRYTSLRRLQLSNTTITDKGLAHLSALKELSSLNLVGTGVTAPGVVKLKDLKQLKNVYLYKTAINASERTELIKNFPGTNLDFGNYSLQSLATDTMLVKYK